MTQHIFLLGAGRSGTKIFRDCLGSAEGVAAIPYDIGYVWRYGNETIPHDELLPEHGSNEISKFVETTLERMARRVSGKNQYDVIIEKSVPNVLRPAFVSKLFPESRFVSIVRDGYAVIESSMRNWRAPSDRGYLLDKLRYFPPQNYRYALWYIANKTKSSFQGRSPTLWGPRYDGMAKDAATLSLVDICALQWMHCVERCAEQLATLAPERVMSVYYDDLIAKPEILRDVCNFCGIANSDQVLDFHTQTFDLDRGSKGASRLTEFERKRIDAIAGKTIRRFCYV